MTSVPDITRLLARIEDWKGQGPVLGRAEAARRLDEAHKLFAGCHQIIAGMMVAAVSRRAAAVAARPAFVR